MVWVSSAPSIPPPSNVHQAEEVPGARGFINNTSPPGTRVRLGPLDVRMNQNFRTYEGYVNDSGRFLTQMDFFLGGGVLYFTPCPFPLPSIDETLDCECAWDGAGWILWTDYESVLSDLMSDVCCV